MFNILHQCNNTCNSLQQVFKIIDDILNANKVIKLLSCIYHYHYKLTGYREINVLPRSLQRYA